jgi:hypothetical protein
MSPVMGILILLGVVVSATLLASLMGGRGGVGPTGDDRRLEELGRRGIDREFDRPHSDDDLL